LVIFSRRAGTCFFLRALRRKLGEDRITSVRSMSYRRETTQRG
jgi:hypothetical protein